MWCLSQREDDVARLLVRKLVCFACERNAVALSRTTGNVEFEDVLRLDNLLAFTFLAALLLWDDLA